MESKISKRIFLRSSYRGHSRDAEHYEANEESFPLGEPFTALGQLHDLRKFDEAARVPGDDAIHAVGG